MQQKEEKAAVIFSDEEREAINSCNDNIRSIPLLLRHKEFLMVHNVPAQNIDREMDSILAQLSLFESVLDRIQDRRTRVVLRCRYALGMKIEDISFIMGISKVSVLNILKAIMPSRTDPEDV